MRFKSSSNATNNEQRGEIPASILGVALAPPLIRARALPWRFFPLLFPIFFDLFIRVIVSALLYYHSSRNHNISVIFCLAFDRWHRSASDSIVPRRFCGNLNFAGLGAFTIFSLFVSSSFFFCLGFQCGEGMKKKWPDWPRFLRDFRFSCPPTRVLLENLCRDRLVSWPSWFFIRLLRLLANDGLVYWTSSVRKFVYFD